MNALLVCLDNIERVHIQHNVRPFLEALKAFELLSGTWIVPTPLRASELRNRLAEVVGTTGRVLVVNITGSKWASFRLERQRNDWLHQHV